MGSLIYMVFAFMRELILTIFPQRNIMLTKDRKGLTRSAMFLFVFIIIHAVGNLHVFLGPDDFNGYGYFYVPGRCSQTFSTRPKPFNPGPLDMALSGPRDN